MKRNIRQYSLKPVETEISIQSKNKLTKIFDSAFLLGILGALGYYLAFSYQKGYRGYYKINSVLYEDITILNILIAMGSIFVTGITVLFIVNILYIFFPGEKHPFIKFYKKQLIPIITLFIIMILISYKQEVIIEYLRALSIILGSLILIAVLISLFQKEKGFLKNLRLVTDIDRGIVDLIKVLFKHQHPFLIVVFMIIVLQLSTVASSLGEKNAAQKENYLIIQNTKSFVVIESFGDYFIIAPINLEKKLITPDFRVIESKSTMQEPLDFSSVQFKGGLEVENIIHK